MARPRTPTARTTRPPRSVPDRPVRPAAPTTIDEYLAPLPAPQRRALEKVRAQIHKAAPGAEEYIGYGLCGFRHGGRQLLYFGAQRHHLALYGALVVEHLEGELAGFERTKGSIHFTPDHPIPAALVTRLVKARLAANLARDAARKKKPALRPRAAAKARPAPAPTRPARRRASDR